MDTIRNIFTARLNQASAKSGISQAEISRELKTTTNTINRWFKGHRFPEPETIDQLAEVLGVSPQWLFGAEEISPREKIESEIMDKIKLVQKMENLETILMSIEAVKRGEDASLIKDEEEA
jgi:transcriptional regulator with XRE-family HTH domain